MTSTLEELARGLTEAEVDRLLYGRFDWRDWQWQDHCGEAGCTFCRGLIPDPTPNRLNEADTTLRAYLEKTHGET